MKTKSLSSRLSLYIIVASALLLLGSVGVIALLSSKGLKTAVIADVTKTLNCSINQIETRMAEVEGAINGVRWAVESNRNDPDYMFEVTKNFIKANENIYGCAIAFEPWYFESKGEYFAPYSYRSKGKIITTQMGNTDYDYFTMDWYQIPKLLKTNGWSEPYFDEGGGNELMSTYSLPLMDENGLAYAVLTADITLDAIIDAVEKIKTFDKSHTFLCSNAGTFISHTDQSRCFNETIFTSALRSGSAEYQDAARMIMKGKDGNSEFETKDGQKCFIVYSHFSNGWSLGAICYEKDVFAALNGLNTLMVLVMIAGLILLFLETRYIIERQTKPLKDFSSAAINIAKGDFSTPLPAVTTEDELGRLHDSMDYMLKSINDYIGKLQTTTAAKQKIESELQIASAIQMSMVPHSFDSDKVDIFADLHPAKEVGGDLYDFTIDGKYLYFVVGDVSGKGVPAALYMAICCAGFRLISGTGLGVDGVISKINNTFAMRNTTNMFVTLFLGRIDLETFEMEYCNGGHNPIIIIDPDGKANYLQSKPNLAAGLFEDFNYEKETVQLKKGSRILVYTDGVSEAENAGKELFGEDRLLAYASSQPVAGTSREFIENLYSVVKGFANGNPQNDDITMMSIKL